MMNLYRQWIFMHLKQKDFVGIVYLKKELVGFVRPFENLVEFLYLYLILDFV